MTGVPRGGVRPFGVVMTGFGAADPQVLAVARIAAIDDVITVVSTAEAGRC